WTLSLLPVWLPTTLLLLGLFYLWDRRAWAREAPEVRAFDGGSEAFGLDGKINFLLIAGVLASTILSPSLEGINRALGVDFASWGLSGGGPWRELFMIAMALLSLRLTPRTLREENRFSWAAIVEVAVLFAGIFITMIPALQLLAAHGGELGLTQPWQYFWATGSLSSFLDNAPTYLVFSTTASAAAFGEAPASLAPLAASPDFAILLEAVALGAVFMGANTYIGNAPNFMVKVIADTAKERRVRMPSFFGYMAWSVGILIPVFVLITLVAFVWLRSYL
ncbi:MAG: sodium:proton antiporter, partial [Deltaproteobacteria bacterium]|nr:sodium:proton antiporter [Deltaproteobacteria bacterium]